MARLLGDFVAGITQTQAWEERRRRIQAQVDSTTPETAALMAEYARWFPTTPSGITRSLSAENIPPDHPVAQFVITQGQYKNLIERGSWNGAWGAPRRRRLDITDQQRKDIGRSAHQAFRQYEAETTTARGLEADIKEAERRGIYSPNSGVLVEPQVSDDGTVSEDSAFFNDLANKLYQQSGQAVPFVSRTGTLSAWDPEHVAGRYPIDPTTAEHVDLSERGVMPGTGTLHPAGGGPEGDQPVGEAPVPTGGPAQESIELTRALMDQVYADAEARSAENINRTAELAKEGARKEAGVFSTYDPGGTLIANPLRALGIVADAPIQEAQGLVRNVRAALHGEDFDFGSQSDLGIILPKLIRGDHVDVGNGILVDPDASVARERRQREADRGQIGGHNVTLGRWMADVVSEPDTKPFQLMSGLVDATVQVYDPTAYALGKAGDIGVAMRTFQPDESAGTFRSFRQFFHGPTAERFLDRNTDLVQWLADTDDPFDIAKRTNFKLDPEITGTLANIPDTHNVRRYLTATVERGRIRRTTDVKGNITQRIVHSWRDTNDTLRPSYTPRTVRMFQTMPGQTIDLDRPEEVARNLINVLHNAHAPEADLRTAYNAVARATTKNGLRDAVAGVFSAHDGPIANMLRSYGVQNDEVISYLTRLNQDTYNEDLRGLIDETGADVPTWEHMNVNGTATRVTGPHLPMEHISRYMHLPDQRAIRRLTTKYKFLTAANTADYLPVLGPIRRAVGAEPSLSLDKMRAPGAPRLPLAFTDYIMSDVLKPAWLLRLAWPIRVVGEEQLRMSTAGMDSAFSGHPLSWLAMVIGNKDSRLARALDAVTPGLKPKNTLDPAGVAMEQLEELQQVTYRAHSSWLDGPGVVRTNMPTVYNKLRPDEVADFRRSWADEIALLNYEPVSNKVANTTDLEDAVDWMYAGPGRRYRRELMEAHPGNLVTRDQVRTYIQSVSDRIHRVTGGNADLLEVVRTGRYGPDKSIFAGAAPRMNPQFSRHLSGYISAAPTKIRGFAYSRTSLNKTFQHDWNMVLDRMMGVLMGTPTSTLSRAPSFKQYLWQRTGDLMPWMDSAAQADVMANARKANLSGRQIKYLEHQMGRGTGKLSLVEANDLAKGYALDDTKGLLYDISQKGQISDILRNFIPFAEAWREVIGRWTQLMFQKGGKPLRRAQQILQGARGEDLGAFLGNPQDQGFFHENEFGEQVFAWPGSQWLMDHETNIPGSPFNLPGMPVPLTGRVQGLNMFGSIFPSLGPVAQIPVAWFLQDKPQYDWWRDQLLPFGGPGAEETSDIFELRDYLPGYLKTAVDWVTEGGTDDRIYNSSVMYVASYLHSTGEYGNSIEEQQRLMEDAKDKARDLYAIRAIGQFILPSSPSASYLIEDKSGNLLSQRILSEEFYNELDKTGDYQETVDWYLGKYGTEAIGAIVPHSRSVIPNIPTSLEGAQWVASHSGIKERHPLVYGMFAPKGDFDITTYLRNFISEERDAITPEQWQAIRDNTLGNYYYQNELSKLGDNATSPTDEQTIWLRGRRGAILEAFPSWGNETGLDTRPETELLVRELYRAAEDPEILRTQAGKGLRDYLGYRDKAQDAAETAGLASFRDSERLAQTRRWLESKAAQIIERYPEFEQMYEWVFSRELTQ
jgi:hypothetical protein